MKRLCAAMVMLMTIAAVGCGNNKVADSGAASSTGDSLNRYTMSAQFLIAG